MRIKIALCYSLLCFMLCLVPYTGLCETEPLFGLFFPEKAAYGAYFIEAMQDDIVVEEFMHTLQNIDYMSISDGKTVTFPFNDRGQALCYRTLDLDTLQQSDDVMLRMFGEDETLLKVLPHEGGFSALTNHALYRYDGGLKLVRTTQLPDALLEMEGLQEKLRLSGEVNQDGTFLLFEVEGNGEGIYLCALVPDAKPSLLLAGTTFTDENGNALEGYREGRFVGPDLVSAYLWDKEGRIAYELFDLDGHRLYQSFVFNQQMGSEISAHESRSEIRRREAEDAKGVLLGDPSSLSTFIDVFYYFDYQTLQIDRVTSLALDGTSLQFCALNGNICTFAVANWSFDKNHRSDIQFFSENLATTEVEELSFVLHDVAEFTAALAPDGRIIFLCRDYTSNVFYRGAFRIP